MALVLRNQIKEKTVCLGRSIETEVISNNLEPLSDDRLEEVIESASYVSQIETLMEKYSGDQLDEFILSEKEKKEEKKAQKIREERIAEVSELALLKGKRNTRRIPYDVAVRVAENLEIELIEPEQYVDCADEDDLMNYRSNDDFWDDYLHVLDLTNHDLGYLEDLIGGSFNDFKELARERVNSLEELKIMASRVQDMELLTYSFILRDFNWVLDFISDKAKTGTKRKRG